MHQFQLRLGCVCGWHNEGLLDFFVGAIPLPCQEVHRRRSKSRLNGGEEQLDSRDYFGDGPVIPIESRSLLGRQKD